MVMGARGRGGWGGWTIVANLLLLGVPLASTARVMMYCFALK